MDDFNTNVLSEAKNEYASRLINILSPLVIQGFRSILKEAQDLCLRNNEDSKYLMTFQNFLTRVPKWNQEIINIETKRIIETSKCPYLEDLLTCVHITQLKVLTSFRVSTQQKKIDIDIPKLTNFIHKIYIDCARTIYKNVYLFENDILPLTQQKNMRETEIIVRESILNVIRSSMPIEQILRAYIDETEEEEVFEEMIDKKVKEPIEPPKEEVNENDTEETTLSNNTDLNISKSDDTEAVESFTNNVVKTESLTPPTNSTTTQVTPQITTQSTTASPVKQTTTPSPVVKPETSQTKLSFNDNDNIVNFKDSDAPQSITNIKSNLVTAPKTIERLEQISEDRYNKRKEEEEEDEDDDDDDEFKLNISDSKEKISLDDLDIHDLSTKKDDIVLNEIEELKGIDLLN